MRLLLLPNVPPIDVSSEGLILTPAAEASVGGYFYDYFHDFAGRIVGVRCWLDTAEFDGNSIFERFRNDERVSPHLEKHCVDVLFDSASISSLARGELTLDSAQDFGGMDVVQAGQSLGLLFSLQV